jgi:hypothetical protein
LEGGFGSKRVSGRRELISSREDELVTDGFNLTSAAFDGRLEAFGSGEAVNEK